MRDDRQRLVTAIGMRNVLVHQYFEIDLEAVWSAVERDLPVFKAKIQAIMGLK